MKIELRDCEDDGDCGREEEGEPPARLAEGASEDRREAEPGDLDGRERTDRTSQHRCRHRFGQGREQDRAQEGVGGAH
jgi:hypothetical protein